MLKSAYLYEDEIRKAFYEIWYDPEYQYYFMGAYHDDFNLDHENGDWHCRSYAVTDKEGCLIGYISYKIDHETQSASSLGAINFTNNIATFGQALYQVINDIFCKYHMNRLEFAVVVGNPVEKSYDRIVKMFGGKILCTKHETAKDMAGNFCDEKLYEIMRKDYLTAKESRKHGKQ